MKRVNARIKRQVSYGRQCTVECRAVTLNCTYDNQWSEREEVIRTCKKVKHQTSDIQTRKLNIKVNRHRGYYQGLDWMSHQSRKLLYWQSITGKLHYCTSISPVLAANVNTVMDINQKNGLVRIFIIILNMLLNIIRLLVKVGGAHPLQNLCLKK